MTQVSLIKISHFANQQLSPSKIKVLPVLLVAKTMYLSIVIKVNIDNEGYDNSVSIQGN